MSRSVVRVLTALSFVAVTTLACSPPNGATTPTTTATTITEDMTATLTPNGALVFPFNTTAAGSLTVTLETIAPDASLVIGLSIGVWDGTTCSVGIDNPNAAESTSVPGNVSGAGALCARVYDSHSALTASEAVEITIVHP